MRSKLFKSLAVVIMLVMTISSNALAFNNDTNGDSYTDRLHIKQDGVALWNEGWSDGCRVTGLTIASIDPYWNQQSSASDSIRVLPDVTSALNAMKAQTYPDSLRELQM